MLMHTIRGSSTTRQQHGRRGMSILYVGVIMMLAIGLVSLAVDMGRVRVGRVQLSAAADASALAGTQKVRVPDVNAARVDAEFVAGENKAIQGMGIGSVVLQDSDVEFGLFRKNTGTFTLLGQNEPAVFGGNKVDDHSCNACRVTTQRSSARSTPIALIFGRIVYKPTIDVSAKATAWTVGQGSMSFGIIGLDWVQLNGTTNTDSYNAASGPYGGGNIHNNGSVGSNGTITMVGTSDIHGNANYGTDSTFNGTNNVNVTGWTAPLDYTLVYPVDYPPVGYAMPGSDDDANNVTPPLKGNVHKFSPNGNATLQAGGPTGRFAFTSWSGNNNVTVEGQTGKNVRSYQGSPTDMGTELYIVGTSLIMNGNLTLKTNNGPITLYISGDFQLKGQAQVIIQNPNNKYPVRFFVNGNWKSDGNQITNSSEPSNLYISMTGANTSMDISTATYAHIMAPVTNITFHGNANNPPADFYGWVVGKTLNVKGNSQLHYDESLPPQGGPIHAVLVK